jgi:hypothetical protein
MNGGADGGVAALTADQIAHLAVGGAETDQPESLLRAVDEVGRVAMDHALFTAMVFDAAEMAVERIYSSDAAAYPLGGRKPKRDTSWGRHVLVERRIYVGEGEAAIREAFADHDLILSLGLRAVVNMPVVFAGEYLGTLNFLWRRSSVRANDVALAHVFALTAAVGFAALRNPQAGEGRTGKG